MADTQLDSLEKRVDRLHKQVTAFWPLTLKLCGLVMLCSAVIFWFITEQVYIGWVVAAGVTFGAGAFIEMYTDTRVLSEGERIPTLDMREARYTELW